MSWFELPNLSKVVICACEPAWSTCLHKAHSIMKTQEPQWGGERLWTSSPLENVSHGGAHRYFGRGREDRCSWSWKLRAGSPVFTLDRGEKKEDIFWNYRVSETTCILPVYHPKWSLTSCLVGKLALTRLMAMLATRQLLTGLIFILRHCATTKQVLQNNDNAVVRALCCCVTFLSSLGE